MKSNRSFHIERVEKDMPILSNGEDTPLEKTPGNLSRIYYMRQKHSKHIKDDINFSQTTSKPAVIEMSQSKFTEVITKSTIFSAVAQEPFVTVKTESFISDSPSSHSNRPIPSPAGLIKQYDAVFKEAEQFIHRELHYWKDNVELKYFNHLYKEHYNMTASITSMRQQAM